MRTPAFAAIQLVVSLVKTTKMALIDACRIAAFQYNVDYQWLYTQLKGK